MLYVLALDLKDDAQLIAQYEAYHWRIPEEIAAHLRRQGVTGMEIYRLGTRLTMLMETNDTVYDPAAMAAENAVNPDVLAWEAMMWRFQAPTPWTGHGEKWTAMSKIFDLAAQTSVHAD